MMRNIRKSLLFVADETPISQIEAKETAQLIPSPNVCIELGLCNLHRSKRSEQILANAAPRLSGTALRLAQLSMFAI